MHTVTTLGALSRRPTPSAPVGRICAGGCGTVLNRYNLGRYCSLCKGPEEETSSMEDDIALFGGQVCAGACGQEKPATEEYFKRYRDREQQLSSVCRACRNAEAKAQYHAHALPDLFRGSRRDSVPVPEECREWLLGLHDSGMSWRQIEARVRVHHCLLGKIARGNRTSISSVTLAAIREAMG